jgi:hypothetical protein
MKKRSEIIVSMCVLAVGTGVSWATESQCKHPATLDGQFQRSENRLLVTVTRDENVEAVAQRIAVKFHLVPAVVHMMHAFYVAIDDESVVAKLRCEPGIVSVSYGEPTYIQSL